MKVCEMLSIGPAAKQSLVNSGMVVTVGDNCHVGEQLIVGSRIWLQWMERVGS